ncbi:two-component system regulatory protein YycI [Lacticaseibacillus hegangensis]|uniref:Two-component system regulatory protein YycI n=1 Tax=Lacticaseibacillus hegangensis TaxID=2486010 RepID=A0ABW4CYN3_9LACO|nr:two-component system regulatory protein YycI [Lacticaseibacillus hegangensis]
MDFRRIEMIFLFVFIALNVFLGISFFQSQQVDLATDAAGTTAILADIKRDDIKLPKLSTSTERGAYLANTTPSPLRQDASRVKGQELHFSDVNGTTLTATLATALNVKTDASARLQRWVARADNVAHGSAYVYQKDLSTATSYVFAQKISGHLVNDPHAQLTLHVSDGHLTGYTQTYLPNLVTLRQDVNLCSAQDAVTTLYRENEITSNSKVLWTRLSYTYLLNAKGSTVYVPAWSVGIESQGSKNLTVKKVNAINKTVLKTRAEE